MKRKRKNPVNKDLLDKLVDSVVDGDPMSLSSAIVYSKYKNKKCKDCGQDFRDCFCEDCPDCEFPSCMCDLDITTDDDIIDMEPIDSINRQKVRIKAFKFIKKNLNKNEINDLMNLANKRLNNKNFIKSLNISKDELINLINLAMG